MKPDQFWVAFGLPLLAILGLVGAVIGKNWGFGPALAFEIGGIVAWMGILIARFRRGAQPPQKGLPRFVLAGLILAPAAIAIAMLTHHSPNAEEVGPDTQKPYIPDEKTALAVGKAILLAHLGSASQAPCALGAKLELGRWRVGYPCGDGLPELRIDETSGKVLGLSLGKGRNQTTPKHTLPDAATALSVGEAILVARFGEKLIQDERPLQVAHKGDRWSVFGHMPEGVVFGGVAEVDLSEITGEVEWLGHGQ